MWPDLLAGSFLDVIDINEIKEATKMLHMVLYIMLRLNFN